MVAYTLLWVARCYGSVYVTKGGALLQQRICYYGWRVAIAAYMFLWSARCYGSIYVTMVGVAMTRTFKLLDELDVVLQSAIKYHLRVIHLPIPLRTHSVRMMSVNNNYNNYLALKITYKYVLYGALQQ